MILTLIMMMMMMMMTITILSSTKVLGTSVIRSH